MITVGGAPGCGDARPPLAARPRAPSAGPAGAPSVGAPVHPDPARLRGRCGSSVDVRALLEAHARGYGSEAAAAALLPIVMGGSAEVHGQKGRLELALTRDRHRMTARVAGLFVASGVDARGAWSLGGGSGVVERLESGEAQDVRIDPWLLRRGYLAFDAARDHAACRDAIEPGGEARIELAYARPELGDPVLVFDVPSAALISAGHRQADGRRSLLTIESWTEVSAGVRWPKQTTEHPTSGSPIMHTIERVTPGLACRAVMPPLVDAELDGEACISPPGDRFSLRWPASGRVRVPMTFLHHQIVVRATIGGREVWALLDSGAGITVVDATASAGQSFKPVAELEGAGATQKIKLGVGALPTLGLGELRADDVPSASVPIPALEAFGAKRPELILGYSFFAAAAIRVDYKRGEVVLARSGGGLAGSGARPIAVRRISGGLAAEGGVEGQTALFKVDTGSSGGLDLVRRWATAHGMPGERRTVTVRGRFGAGAAETPATFFRLEKAVVGPIRLDGQLTQIADPPDTGDLAGLVGNGAFARCDAVVFDPATRNLLVEGACDRPLPENKMGWRLARKADPAFPERPWVVGTLWPEGAAERAGVREGDRVLEVGGRPATLDLEPLTRIEEQPVGTNVAVVVARAAPGEPRKPAERLTLRVALAPLLPLVAEAGPSGKR